MNNQHLINRINRRNQRKLSDEQLGTYCLIGMVAVLIVASIVKHFAA